MGVLGFHDLHIWAISTTEVSLSVHVIANSQFVLKSLQEKLAKDFKIEHTTIQVESEESCDVEC